MSMKPKVVYILGAGASANALPMVSQIPGRLGAHLKLLEAPTFQERFTSLFDTEPRLSFNQVLDQYQTDIRHLQKMADVHESIDTYAKKLFLKGAKDELFRMKVALSMFLAYEQAKNAAKERRYDGFFASILGSDGSGLRIPDDILILNWNYDQMLGHAFKEYTSSGQFQECHTQLRVYPLHQVNEDASFSVVHLNGLFAYQWQEREYEPLVTTTSDDDKLIVEDLLRYYYRAHHNESNPLYRNMDAHLMRFAWESFEQQRSAFSSILNRLIDTQALVVIGYSFPFFNREFDRDILKWLPNLERIYVQAPEGYAQDIGRTIRTMGVAREVEIEYYTNTDKFLLPREL